jgi:predicted transcriptional regulator
MSNGDNAARETLYGFKVREPDKRRNPNGRSVDIKSLWDRQHEILNLNALGYKGSEIAKLLGIHPVTVSNCLNSTLGKEAKSDIRKERDDEYEQLREEVLELTKKGLEVYKKILENVSVYGAKLQKETADTVVLELAGMRAPTRIDTRSMHMSVTTDEIEEFKRRGIEAARVSGRLVKLDDPEADRN